MTFIETLIALAILVILVVGILQMFMLSLQVTKGSQARTQLVYKAQQVAEAIKWLNYQASFGATQVPSGSGITVPFTGQVAQTYLPTQPDAFWGPQGLNVIEAADAPYRLAYEIVDNDDAGLGGIVEPGTWGIVVTAIPAQVLGQSAAYNYQGTGINNKRVRYVTSVLKVNP